MFPTSFRRCFESGCGIILVPIKQWGHSIRNRGKRRVCVNKPAVALRVAVWCANINSLKPQGVCFWNYLAIASHAGKLKNTWNPARGFVRKHFLSWDLVNLGGKAIYSRLFGSWLRRLEPFKINASEYYPEDKANCCRIRSGREKGRVTWNKIK